MCVCGCVCIQCLFAIVLIAFNSSHILLCCFPMLNCFKLLFPKSINTPYTVIIKQKQKVFNIFIEGSQKQIVFSVTLNIRSLKQLGFFLELASWPNWAIDGKGFWLEWWPRTWSLYLKKCNKRQQHNKMWKKLILLQGTLNIFIYHKLY